MSTNQDGTWKEGEVFLRCSSHDIIHGQWLVQKGREGNLGKDDAAIEGRWTKEEVANIVCQEDYEGTTILSLLDFETQKELAFWKREKTTEVAHQMGNKFLLWLIDQASEGKWSKEDVGSIACRRNNDNQLILATLDEETQRQVAVFNK